MAAKYILGVIAVGFLLAALIRFARDGGHVGPACRTWLLVAIIFAVVSTGLWIHGRS